MKYDRVRKERGGAQPHMPLWVVSSGLFNVEVLFWQMSDELVILLFVQEGIKKDSPESLVV